jgi:hypothetical protein
MLKVLPTLHTAQMNEVYLQHDLDERKIPPLSSPWLSHAQDSIKIPAEN